MGNEDGRQPNSIPSMVSTFIQFHQQVPMQQRAVGFGHWKDPFCTGISASPQLCANGLWWEIGLEKGSVIPQPFLGAESSWHCLLSWAPMGAAAITVYQCCRGLLMEVFSSA